MASKTILLLALLSMVLLIASQASSRELLETSDADEMNGVAGSLSHGGGGDGGYKGKGGYHCKCCHKYYCKCCKSGARQNPVEGKPQN